MKTLWKAAYGGAVLPLFWVALHLMAPFNAKIRRGIRGRRHLFPLLERRMATLGPGRRVWFHSSSMGEFEQAKPMIAELKQRFPDVRVIVSFFSPSGYEHSRRYPLADAVCYLPFDSRRRARRFLNLVRPDAAVMVRYDIWPNHIWELRQRGVPTMIANATMRRQTPRRIPGGRAFHFLVYNAIDRILTVSEADAEAFRLFGVTHPLIEPVGDTRYDQVMIRSAEARQRNLVPAQILSGRRILVVGSSWPEDESVVLPAVFALQNTVKDLLTIIVPHEPTVEHLESLEADLQGRAKSIRFSALNEYLDERVIIVDSVGILSVLYACAHIAYIGGSFRQGVHNVLEAAVFGIPVVFGPRHRNSREPLQLAERGGAFVVTDTEELVRTLDNLLSDDSARRFAGERAAAFVRSQIGATGRFLGHLESMIGNTTPAPGGAV